VVNHRAITVVISDFLGQPATSPAGLFRRPRLLMTESLVQSAYSALRQANRRHDVVAIQIVDRFELELPALGRLVFKDAETGEVVELDTGNARNRQAFREGRALKVRIVVTEDRGRLAAQGTRRRVLTPSCAGERLTFVGRVRDPAGDRLEVENLVKPGSGPPMHVHTYQEEALTIQQGRLGYQRSGAPPQYAEPGETVVFEPGEAHRFWNAGEEDLLGTGYIRPADNAEYFLTAIFESQRESGGSRQDPFEVAFLMRRYRSEFYMSEIPAVVQRFVFPVLVTVGRVLGKYGKYADAPEPVRR
jgi:quercetin dioxygenase-like cupin family protein